MDDAVRDLGHLALGTRLKRLGDRLQMQAQVILDEAGVPVPASHLPPLAVLESRGSLTVGGLSRALGVTQPGVTRMAAALEEAGLVGSATSEDDRRARLLALTPAGRKLLARLQRRAFPRIEAAVREACGPASATLLADLAALEDALERQPLALRTLRPATGGR